MNAARMPHTAWRVNDLIDLEYLLQRESEEHPGIGGDATSAEDRRIYLEFSSSSTPPHNRRDLLKVWLAEKRKAAAVSSGGPLPGAMFDEILSLARVVIIIAALLSGMTLAWSVLSYRGEAPINIFTCLWVFIFPQILLLIMLGGMSVFRSLGLTRGKWGIYPLLTVLLRRAALSLKSAGEQQFSGKQRQHVSAALGMIGRHKTIYGPVFYRPVFILFQMFGVFFNVGLLTATLFRIMITDLAFGWQTTLAAGAETVHRIVGWISFPWSFLSPLFPVHPSLAQIQGSRIILKDGMAHLTTPDLVSWWPFLVMTILFYGLLPRVLLLIYGTIAQVRDLKSLDFSHSACDRLIRRMQTPLIKTRGIRSPDPARFPGVEKSPADPAAHAASDSSMPVITGLPAEIDAGCTDDELEERIHRLLGSLSPYRFRLTMDPETDAASLQSLLSQIRGRDGDIRVLLVQEAWLPPIRESLSWIRFMRDAAGPRTGIIIGLVGKPLPDNFLTPPGDADRIIWDRAAAGLGDPYLRTEALGG
jgi:hypothetical protein